MTKKVLVVEDEEVLVRLFSEAFAREGIDTVIARDGLEALALATTIIPDFIGPSAVILDEHNEEVKLKVNDLIKAIPNINKKYHFLLMGYPVEEAKKLAKDLGVLDRITFTGQIDYFKAPSYLVLGDYAISPKKTFESYEANAKLYTYKAMNLRTICYDNNENKKIMGKMGIYIKNFNEIK